MITMAAAILTVNSRAPEARLIEEAAACLRGGGLVAFPTETVYGLGARADAPEAVARLIRVKGRPEGKPFSVLVADADAAQAPAEVSPIAQQLMQRYWPGPLTLVLPGKTGGMVGLRCPDHPVAQALVRAAGVPIAAPSANQSGGAELRTASEVQAALGGAIDLILDGGPARLPAALAAQAGAGRPSTVVEVTPSGWRVLREGALSVAAITEALR